MMLKKSLVLHTEVDQIFVLTKILKYFKLICFHYSLSNYIRVLKTKWHWRNISTMLQHNNSFFPKKPQKFTELSEFTESKNPKKSIKWGYLSLHGTGLINMLIPSPANED